MLSQQQRVQGVWLSNLSYQCLINISLGLNTPSYYPRLHLSFEFSQPTLPLILSFMLSLTWKADLGWLQRFDILFSCLAYSHSRNCRLDGENWGFYHRNGLMELYKTLRSFFASEMEAIPLFFIIEFLRVWHIFQGIIYCMWTAIWNRYSILALC